MNFKIKSINYAIKFKYSFPLFDVKLLLLYYIIILYHCFSGIWEIFTNTLDLSYCWKWSSENIFVQTGTHSDRCLTVVSSQPSKPNCLNLILSYLFEPSSLVWTHTTQCVEFLFALVQVISNNKRIELSLIHEKYRFFGSNRSVLTTTTYTPTTFLFSVSLPLGTVYRALLTAVSLSPMVP